MTDEVTMYVTKDYDKHGVREITGRVFDFLDASFFNPSQRDDCVRLGPMFNLRVGKDVHKTKREALDYVFKTHIDLAKKYARKTSDYEAVALDALRQLRELDDEAEKSE